MARFSPTTLDELRDVVSDAQAAEAPLEIVAGGTKRGFGRRSQVPRTLDLARLAGVSDCAPSDLVLAAGAATRLAEIEAILVASGQMLAFDPPTLEHPHDRSRPRRLYLSFSA
jgi:glycolate oxidase FAD binding subunit